MAARKRSAIGLFGCGTKASHLRAIASTGARLSRRYSGSHLTAGCAEIAEKPFQLSALSAFTSVVIALRLARGYWRPSRRPGRTWMLTVAAPTDLSRRLRWNITR